MKVRVTDEGTLRSVRVANLQDYLMTTGWDQVGEYGPNANVWKTFDLNGGAEIVVPTTDEVRDYASRISEVLTVLQEKEDRSEISILEDIFLVSSDVVRVRYPVGNRSGIGLEEGVELVENTQSMLTAAAVTALRPRRKIPSHRPKEAEEYMKSVQLGHTEPGSFVVKVISPLLEYEQSELFAADARDSYPRRVIRRLFQSLTAAQFAARAAMETQDIRVFDDAVQQGVSADLCDAIAGLSESGEQANDVDVGFTWSAKKPEPEDRRAVRIDRRTVPKLNEGAEYLKREPRLEGKPVMGPVIRLHREEGEETGDITVAAYIEGGEKKLQVELSGREYERAIEAHRQGQLVAFKADIERTGRRYWAENIREFRIEE